ncbi:MAG: DUF262 domain-containing protein [Prevotella sp.]|nr:DUF262 domain-containing protein [Prevotella sp.]
MANIELKTVCELLDMKFFIPSYQRGYRWTEQQVKDLLNDLRDFEPQELPDSKEKTWYCLQPLVIKKMEEKDSRLPENDKKNWYEVIDGQQRLTTIYIILKTMEENSKFPTIQYQTRPKSGEFLNGINSKSEEDDSNIDFHFMLSTKKVVGEKKDNLGPNFAEKLKNSCKVIWYETQDNAYDVFKRLNSGKISLSNAELIKALLLKDDNFRGMSADALCLKQLEMAGEWDRMEQTLHDNSFWFFINPEPKNARFNCTRIDFLLEMVLRSEKEETDEKNENKYEYKYDIDKELRLNDYFIFSTYSKLINDDGWEKQWCTIQRCFRIMKSWYDDRQLYHYVGYLMNLKGNKKMEMLRDLLCEADKTKNKFLSSLIERCQRSLGISEQKQNVDFANWEYGKNNKEIHNVLLLFNLATTQNQISEVSRYPFDKHFEAAEKKWSLEHIHAQNAKPKTEWQEDEIAQLKQFAKSFRFTANEPDTVDKMMTDFVNSINKTIITTEENGQFPFYKVIVGAMMGIRVKRNESTFVLTEDFVKDDHLTNMALLQGDKNAAFNNKLYAEKRTKLAEYENVEKESMFVPICTRNVFFKHYSPSSMNPFIWDEQAEVEYVTTMAKVIASYLQLEAILPIENEEIKYGVKVKESKI